MPHRLFSGKHALKYLPQNFRPQLRVQLCFLQQTARAPQAWAPGIIAAATFAGGLRSIAGAHRWTTAER